MWFLLIGLIIIAFGIYFIRIGVREFRENEMDFTPIRAVWKFFESSNEFFIGFIFSLIGVLFVYGGFGLIELQV